MFNENDLVRLGDVKEECLKISFYPALINAALMRTPAVDAVEVVRCKDCKHGRPPRNDIAPEKYFKDDCIVCQCEDVVGDEPMIYKPAHFCSYGKIKER